jgi:hypothetical protein
MQSNAGGLVFNHTGNISLANTVRSVPSGTTWTGGALINVAGDTTLTGDLTAFGGKVDVRAGTLVLNSNLYTGQGYTDPSLALAQQIDVSGGTLVLNGSAGFQQTLKPGRHLQRGAQLQRQRARRRRAGRQCHRGRYLRDQRRRALAGPWQRGHDHR